MEFLFIKRIVDKNLFENNSKTVIYNDLFNYHSEKTELIKYSNNNTDNENNKEKDKDDYEFVSLTPLNEKEEEEMNNYMTQVKEEIVRIEKVIEYMIVNIPDIHKIKLLNYKTYDYDNTSKFIKSKVKAKANNHNFDILKFILKNKINKDEVLITEKDGEIVFANIKSKDVRKVKHNLNYKVDGQGGLLDILKYNNDIFICYTEDRGGGKTSTSIAKATFTKENLNFKNIYI